ncbi:hypothetical protein BJV78DRAFT_1153026 [Lactifluus subvellereus]|nr:hypothetical protein BJV78DRAFT_1153026 [Lactifluus subvellereus]
MRGKRIQKSLAELARVNKRELCGRRAHHDCHRDGTPESRGRHPSPPVTRGPGWVDSDLVVLIMLLRRVFKFKVRVKTVRRLGHGPSLAVSTGPDTGRTFISTLHLTSVTDSEPVSSMKTIVLMLGGLQRDGMLFLGVISLPSWLAMSAPDWPFLAVGLLYSSLPYTLNSRTTLMAQTDNQRVGDPPNTPQGPRAWGVGVDLTQYELNDGRRAPRQHAGTDHRRGTSTLPSPGDSDEQLLVTLAL